jgi:hypothetical protein
MLESSNATAPASFRSAHFCRNLGNRATTSATRLLKVHVGRHCAITPYEHVFVRLTCRWKSVSQKEGRGATAVR